MCLLMIICYLKKNMPEMPYLHYFQGKFMYIFNLISIGLHDFFIFKESKCCICVKKKPDLKIHTVHN